MSHILKKIAIAGGGKKPPEPKPPVYKPPMLGELQYGASYSYAETLDLISDGPIEGIVNRHGRVVDNLEVLQGIYLNDTPIAVTPAQRRADAGDSLSESEIAKIENLKPMKLADGATTGVKQMRYFFQALNSQGVGNKITNWKGANGIGGGPDNNERYPPSGGVNMLYMRRRTHTGSDRSPDSPPKRKDHYSVYARAYVRYGSSNRFYWHLNGNYRSEFSGFGNGRVYRNGNKRKGGSNGTQSMYWTSAGRNLFHPTQFFFGISAQKSGLPDFHPSFGGTNFRAQQFVYGAHNDPQRALCELKEIYKLYTDNVDPVAGNKYQKLLAQKALGNLGSGWTSGRLSMLLADWLNRPRGMERFVAIIKVSRDNPNLNQNLLDADGELRPMTTYPYGGNHKWNLQEVMRNSGIRWRDVSCPEIDKEGNLTGKMYGFLVFQIDTGTYFKEMRSSGKKFGIARTFWFSKKAKDALKDIQSLQYSEPIVEPELRNEFEITDLKYNFSNVLAEVNTGEEFQQPLSYFTKVFIDHIYNAELFGPFSSKNDIEPQRIEEDINMFKRGSVLRKGSDGFNTRMSSGLPANEGSDDDRITGKEEDGSGGSEKGFSSWGKGSMTNWDERALPHTHTIYNPNVTDVYITLNVSALRDTLVNDKVKVNPGTSGNEQKKLSIGTTFPSVVNIMVETGRISVNGTMRPTATYTYRIVALIEGDTIIDIGNPDYVMGDKGRQEYILPLDTNLRLNQAFKLPSVRTQNATTLTADGEIGIEVGTLEQDSTEKRFVRVTKLSFETNSVLLHKTVSLNKVTEIIPTEFPYPFSAIVGTKIDSRALGSIPKRSFDCKLKRVKIPSNYKPVGDNGRDLRYYDSVEEWENTDKEDKLIYEGDWDGSFAPRLEWTDNPAWILYDLLTNNRYGMGTHIDPATINKWQLYNIGRFCDAVDDEGYFQGVTDGRGGKEPRFSCNIVFDQGQKIFDAINTIAGFFMGRVFFGNSEVNFVDDRPRNTVNLFTNESVKDGLFYYSNNRRDEQFNCVEVSFKDRFDNFAPKLEVVEDEEDIRQRGYFKKRIEGVGITSRAMARRVGQHQIFAKIKENQKVAFTAGLESLLCQPGDLVVIEDELKTNKANFGRVLAVDTEAETVRVTNTFVDSDMTGRLTVYNPTGRDTIEEVNDLADKKRSRYGNFTVTGAASVDWVNYTGDYAFSGYIDGYSAVTEGFFSNNEESYALYTGFTVGSDAAPITERQTILYFETGVSGWAFGSGDCVSKASGDFISQIATGDPIEILMTGGNITNLDMTAATKRGSDIHAFSGIDPTSKIGPFVGALERETKLGSPDQMTILSVTGNILSGPSELAAAGLNNYGSLLSGFDRPDLLQFIKLGSPSKFEIKDASPFIYKVVGLEENAPNEYLVTATKYETGKYALIEDNISIEYAANTYSYQQAQTINDVTYTTLAAPSFTSITTGVPNATDQTFTILANFVSGSGTYPTSATTGYHSILTYPNGGVDEQTISSDDDLTASFTGLNQVGVYNMSVNALGNKGGNGEVNAYFDSQFTHTGIFVVYDELLEFSKSFLDKITIL